MRHGAPPAAFLAAALALAFHAGALAGTPPFPREREMPGHYDSLAIGKPASDATVHDNDGDVEVSVVVSPALRAGDRALLSVDGRPTPAQERTRFELSGLARGEHSLRAAIVDRSGRTLIASAPITFNMWRASRLFPGRR